MCAVKHPAMKALRGINILAKLVTPCKRKTFLQITDYFCYKIKPL
jgi:hypothetical protein